MYGSAVTVVAGAVAAVAIVVIVIVAVAGDWNANHPRQR